MSNPVIEYYHKHKNLIEHNLVLSKDPEDIEAIHDMRLSIKRLRVVVRLVYLLNKDFDPSESMHHINYLFKRSGRLRDLQVCRQLFHELKKHELEPLISRLDSRITKRRLKFEAALHGFDPLYLERIEKDIDVATKHLPSKAFLAEGHAMLMILINDIHEIFHGSNDERRLHRIRRRIKDINYLNNIFEEHIGIDESLNLSAERIRELGDLAGSWHDQLNMEKEMKAFIQKYPDVSNAEFSNILTVVITQKETLYQEYSCALINELKV
jgi:CHAD domain-containing protein